MGQRHTKASGMSCYRNTEEAQKKDHSSDLDASYFLQSRDITECPNNLTLTLRRAL